MYHPISYLSQPTDARIFDDGSDSPRRMINRIAHLFPTANMPSTPPDNPKRKLRLMTDADLEHIIKSRDTAGHVNMLHPLELFLNKAYLTEVIRASLTGLYERDTAHETDEQRRAVTVALQQRIDFLSWLSGQPDQVYMALYPADDDGLEDIEDLTELLADDTNPELPF